MALQPQVTVQRNSMAITPPATMAIAKTPPSNNSSMTTVVPSKASASTTPHSNPSSTKAPAKMAIATVASPKKPGGTTVLVPEASASTAPHMSSCVTTEPTKIPGSTAASPKDTSATTALLSDANGSTAPRRNASASTEAAKITRATTVPEKNPSAPTALLPEGTLCMAPPVNLTASTALMQEAIPATAAPKTPIVTAALGKRSNRAAAQGVARCPFCGQGSRGGPEGRGQDEEVHMQHKRNFRTAGTQIHWRVRVVFVLGIIVIAALSSQSYFFFVNYPDGDVPARYPKTKVIPESYHVPFRKRKHDHNLPRILLYNRTGHSWRTRYPERSVACPNKYNYNYVCEVTTFERDFWSSDAVVVISDRLTNLHMPKMLYAFQFWVFWTKEARPPQDERVMGSDSSLLKLRSNLFTWTMAYRDDADIVLPYKTWRCGSPTDTPISSIVKQNHEILTIKPRKDAAWIVGSGEQYFFEKHMNAFGPVADQANFTSVNDTSMGGTISVRLFRDCGVKECLSRGACIRHIAENYNFIVVSLKPECFQSAYELIYDAFEYDVVPVVLAPPNSTLNVPDHSVITSADMREPGELAARLRDVISDPARYESYFAWKRNCSWTEPEKELCPLCHALWNAPEESVMPVRYVSEWWNRRSLREREDMHGIDSAFVPEY
ncbi:hypothetical protein MTO96_036265 [Rhipicephalus appendiculatus]